jgi:hypothetical protein
MANNLIKKLRVNANCFTSALRLLVKMIMYSDRVHKHHCSHIMLVQRLRSQTKGDLIQQIGNHCKSVHTCFNTTSQDNYVW